MPVRVLDTEESAALDAAAISAGTPSRALMRAAASSAAMVLGARYPDAMRRGVTVVTGSGNNGGDGWALAAALHTAGVHVSVQEIAGSRATDAMAERTGAMALLGSGGLGGNADAGVVVDAMLGTGSSGALRGAMARAAQEMAVARNDGAVVMSLDLPSGVDATAGAVGTTVVADITVSFGSCKRGSLISRATCGEIVVADIGLGVACDSLAPDIPVLVDEQFVRHNVPPIPPDAHKGTRRSVAVVAGGPNMGGAAILAATGALSSGAGLVKVCTAPGNIAALHARIPEALVAQLDAASAAVAGWADAVLIGPGLAADDATRDFVRGVLDAWRGPVVVDAGALTVFAGDLEALRDALAGQERPAIITPHPGELGRLAGCSIADVLANRFDIGLEVARAIDATVLLKGTPTVVSDPRGTRFVVAAGTAALATGGSGDTLGGMVATLLAQGCEPRVAAACAAWVHGRAAELTPGVRGYRLTDVLKRLPQAWSLNGSPPEYPVLASLPALV